MKIKMEKRLKAIIDFLGISQNEFGRRLGVSSTVISHWMTGRNGPSANNLENLLQIFPQFDGDWLLRGEGTMLKADRVNAFREDETHYENVADRIKKMEEEMRELKEKTSHLTQQVVHLQEEKEALLKQKDKKE